MGAIGDFVQLIDEQERLVTVLRREITEMELSRTSPMASIAAALSPAEVADLVAYLLSLRGAS